MSKIKIQNKNLGLTLLLASAIIYGSALIAASIYSLTLGGVDGQGWNGDYGIYGTAIREVGTLPLVLAVLIGIAGVAILVMQERKV